MMKRIYDVGGKVRAIAAVQNEIREGRLPRVHTLKCVDCGAQAARYDHRDYNRPIDVVPVCSSCNLHRGPAIPLKGLFAHAFDREYVMYSRKADMGKLFRTMGFDADISGLPKTLKFEHWLPFKAQLLEWESERRTKASSKSE